MKSYQLNHILNNKTLGSSELVQLLNNYLLSISDNIPVIIKTARIVKTKLGHFETVNSYLDEMSSVIKVKEKKELLEFFKEYSINENQKAKIIFNRIYPRLKEIPNVITLSRSGTVLAVLKLLHQKNKKIKVVVCESRPKFEGRLTVKELSEVGIKVELITDAMMGLYVPKIDAAIIGADVVLNNGNLVNKVGSRALGILCKEYKKPFYVVTSKSKLSKKKIFKAKKEKPQEIWDKKLRNLRIHNFYFEELEKKLITKIFTD
jgi:translation initiation factor 2B subunit (eIF-2B alpha/beta/delta family)